MAKPSRLKEAFDKHQGRDRTREHRLEKQKKSEKAAEEKRKKKSPQEVKGAISDAALEAGVAAILGGQDVEGEDDDDEDMEGWEDATSEEDSDDEDEGELQYDLGRLDESDSDSEIDDDEEELDAPASTKAPKSILKQPSTTTKSLNAQTTADSGDEEDDDEEDIPLSDIDEEADGADDIIPYQRLTINNTAALTKALTSIALPTSSMPFSEHLTISTSAPVDIPDINDDLNRELALYSQSMSAVQEARRLLRKEDKDFPFSRPADYFAEMVKDDEQMAKVKSRLIEAAASKQASADAKKRRGLKKFGKAVQQQREQERAQEKRKMLDTVKNLKRKRRDEVGPGEHTIEADIFDVSAEPAMDNERQNKRRKGGRDGRDGQPNGKRAAKNEKFGRGGKKKHSKENDAKSSGFEAFGAKKKGAFRPGKGGRAAGAARR